MPVNVTLCKQRLHRFVSLLLVLALCCFARSTAVALDAVNFKIHFTINSPYTYLFVAKEKGFYADADLDVKFFTGTGSLAALTELSESKWDFSTGDFGDVIQLVAKGADIKALFFTYQRTPIGYGVWKDSNIMSVKDFAGKKYGSQKFNLATKALPLLCKVNNIDCDTIKFVNVDFNVQVVSFINGDFDILGGFFNQHAVLLESLGKKIRWIEAADVYQEVIATTGKLLQSRPDVVKRFITATAKGAKYVVEHPDEAVDIMLKIHPQLAGGPDVRQLALRQVKSWASLVRSSDTDRYGYGYGAAEKIAATLGFYSEIGGLTGVSPASVYTLP
jgi:ABC-type nitrate/sulfonate/bicarbonate transport system substrate-binding protein